MARRRRELWAKDIAVRASIAGAETPDGSLRGLPTFEYDMGPDGRPYAVGDSGIRTQVPVPADEATGSEAMKGAISSAAFDTADLAPAGSNGAVDPRSGPDSAVDPASSSTGLLVAEDVPLTRTTTAGHGAEPMPRARSSQVIDPSSFALDAYAASPGSPSAGMTVRGGHTLESIDVWV